MTTVLLWAVILGLYVGGPLLFMFFQERVKNIARESSEMVLADYRHKHEQALASVNAENQRRLEEFALYLTKRNQVYSLLYRRFRMASDSYAQMMGLTFSPDFTKYKAADARAYMERQKGIVPPHMAQPPLEAYERGDMKFAAQLMDDLHRKIQQFTAERAFVKAKNVEAAYELYLSDAVRLQLDKVRSSIAGVSVHMDADERDTRKLDRKEVMTSAVAGLLHIMRDELRRGETPDGSAVLGAGGHARPS